MNFKQEVERYFRLHGFQYFSRMGTIQTKVPFIHPSSSMYSASVICLWATSEKRHTVEHFKYIPSRLRSFLLSLEAAVSIQRCWVMVMVSDPKSLTVVQLSNSWHDT